jgi:transcriptional regulator with XRE-family HTH domain
MKLSGYLKGKSRADLAKKVKVSKGYIDNLCSNSRYVPGRKLAYRIEQATGGAVTTQELLYPEAE